MWGRNQPLSNILLFWYILIYSFSNQKRTWRIGSRKWWGVCVNLSWLCLWISRIGWSALVSENGERVRSSECVLARKRTHDMVGDGLLARWDAPTCILQYLTMRRRHPCSFHFEGMFEQRLKMFHVFHVTIRTPCVRSGCDRCVPQSMSPQAPRLQVGFTMRDLLKENGETSWSMWCPLWCPLLVSVVGLWSLHGECPLDK